MMRALVYDTRPWRWALCKAIGAVRPGVYWSALSGLRPASVPVPPLPSPAWVRLRPILGGICGTDLAVILQRQHPASILQAFSSLPAVCGHENVAVVDRVGPAVTRFAPGDRVVVEPTLSCVPRGIDPVCRPCAAGRFTLCERFRDGALPPGSMIGWNRFTGGSWAPFFVAHESQLYRVPDALGDEEAVLVDPAAGAVHAVLRHAPPDDQTALILGGGFMGVSLVAALRALGCRSRLVGLARTPAQAERMRAFGADETVAIPAGTGQADRYAAIADLIGGRIVPTRFGHHAFIGGFDTVYDCVGTGSSLTDAMKYARARGTVVQVGTSQIVLADTCPLWFNEQTVLGVNGRAIEEHAGRRLHTYEIVFDLMTRGRLRLSGLLTHRFGLEDWRRALATAAGLCGDAVKVAFEQPPPSKRPPAPMT